MRMMICLDGSYRKETGIFMGRDDVHSVLLQAMIIIVLQSREV